MSILLLPMLLSNSYSLTLSLPSYGNAGKSCAFGILNPPPEFCASAGGVSAILPSAVIFTPSRLAGIFAFAMAALYSLFVKLNVYFAVVLCSISITPLSIPMLCGPGAIANGIILMDDADTWTLKITLVSVIAIVYILTYIILRLSTRLVKLIGETGNNVMMRLMGLILMVIAVECFVGGMKPILLEIIHTPSI